MASADVTSQTSFCWSCLNHVSVRTFPYRNNKVVTRLLQPCINKVVTTLSPPSLGFEPVTRLSQGCHKVVAGLYVAGLYFTTSAQACHNVVVVQYVNHWTLLWADLFFAACRALEQRSDSINQNTFGAVFVHIRCVTKHSSVKNGTAVNYIFICYLPIHVEIMSWYSGCSWPVTTWDS